MSPSVGQNLAPTLENTMTDDEKMALVRDILQHHFGTYLKVEKRTECWVCDGPWPCPPVRLAQAVQEEVLAR